jgi:hypothetical protein
LLNFQVFWQFLLNKEQHGCIKVLEIGECGFMPSQVSRIVGSDKIIILHHHVIHVLCGDVVFNLICVWCSSCDVANLLCKD